MVPHRAACPPSSAGGGAAFPSDGAFADGPALLTFLEEHIESCEFEEALERIASHPEEILPAGTVLHGAESAGYGKPGGNGGRMTALHVALENAHTPPPLIRAILAACPLSVRAVDEHGALPLHYACSGNHAYGDDGEELISLLLQMYPPAAAVAERAEGATPLHYLLRSSGEVRGVVVGTLLDAAYGRTVGGAAAVAEMAMAKPISLGVEWNVGTVADAAGANTMRALAPAAGGGISTAADLMTHAKASFASAVADTVTAACAADPPDLAALAEAARAREQQMQLNQEHDAATLVQGAEGTGGAIDSTAAMVATARESTVVTALGALLSGVSPVQPDLTTLLLLQSLVDGGGLSLETAAPESVVAAAATSDMVGAGISNPNAAMPPAVLHNEPLASLLGGGAGHTADLLRPATTQKEDCGIGKGGTVSTSKSCILRLRDRTKQPPLHLACSGGGHNGGGARSIDVIKILLDEVAYPGARKVASELDGKGRLALHHILTSSCSSADGSVPDPPAVAAVLEAHPASALVPDGITGLSPVQLAYVSAPSAARRLCLDEVFHVSGIDPEGYQARQLWETIKMVVLTAANVADKKVTTKKEEDSGNGIAVKVGGNTETSHNQKQHSRDHRPSVLHAVARFHCPPRVVRCAIFLHSNQVRMRNACGDLPLHIAARRHLILRGVSDKGVGGDWQLCMHPWLPVEFVRGKSGEDGGADGAVSYKRFLAEEEEVNREQLCNNSTQSKLCRDDEDDLSILVNQFPAGACYLDQDGRLPINLAIESGRPWTSGGVRDVADAAPMALVTRDTKTRLYPFMLAAVGDISNLDTIFGLLKAAPSALTGGLFTCKRDRAAGAVSAERIERKTSQSAIGGDALSSQQHKRQRLV